MSVLFNSSEFYNYFYSRYINVGFFGTHLDFLLESWYGCDNNLFDFFTVSNERELINALPTGNRNQCRRKNLIITATIQNLKRGYYLYGVIDEYYVPNRRSTLREHFIHDFFVNGFDVKKNVFYLYGYSSNRKYKRVEISFEDFENGINGTDGLSLCFFQIHRYQSFFLDLKKIYKEIGAYLNSENRTYNVSDSEKNVYYGLSVYGALCNDLEKNVKQNDLRGLRILWEHKQCMLQRLILMKKRGESINYNIIDKYNELVKKHEILFRLSMKWNINNDLEILHSICQKLETYPYEEESILSQIVP